MNIFKDNTAPYIFVILFSMAGWLLGEAVKDAENTYFLSYDLKVVEIQDVRKITATIKNHSFSKTLANATFSLSCKYDEQCFTASGDEELENVDAIPEFVAPWANKEVGKVIASQRSIQMTISIQNGGEVRLVSYLSPNSSLPNFFYLTPSKDAPSVRIHEGFYVLGHLLENFIQIIYTLFIVIGFLVLLLIFTNFIAVFRSSKVS